MTKREILGLGAVGLIVLSGLVFLMLSIDEDMSKHEDDWRLGTSKYFQQDFPTVKENK